jgi:uncharacterized membrane protein
MPGRLALVAIAAALAVTVLAPEAGAATLKADYQFQSTYASSVPGSPDIGLASGGQKFVTETVGCTPTRVLSFPKGSGVQLNVTSLVNRDVYSIVVMFRLSDVSGYRRIFAPGNPNYDTDNGLYDFSGQLYFFDTMNFGAGLGPGVVFADDTFAEVAFTHDDSPSSLSPQTIGYVNGVQEFGYHSHAGEAQNMRFFKDNDSGGVLNEDSAGAVARIRIYNGILTPSEVVATADSGPLAGACNSSQHATAAVNGKVKVKRGRHGRFVVLTGIEAGCPIGLGTCTGTAAVDKAGGSQRLATASRAPKHLGKKALSVAAGKTQKVKVKLTRRASDALRSKGKLKVKISVKLTPPGGTAAIASRKAKIKPPH